MQARVVQIAQVTELGTCYSLTELKALQDFCASEGLRVYIDGARIANAVAHLDCTLADIAACADVLSFGGTKNGAMGVEAVLVMTEGLAEEAAPYLRKQQMQLSSKMRFLSAQVIGLLEDDVWLQNAAPRQRHGGSAGGRPLADVPGVRLAYPMESNGVFAEIRTGLAEALASRLDLPRLVRRARRPLRGPAMTAYDTSEADVDALVADDRRAVMIHVKPWPVSGRVCVNEA